MHSTKNNLEVLFEDNHLLIVNKKSGDIVQGDKTGDKPLSEVVKEYIKEKYNKPGDVFLGVVHRLDRPTSGIIIFARTSKALERLNKMLRDRVISKTYWAIIKNNPKKVKDTLIHFLKKNPKNNKSTVFTKKTEGSKKAILHFTIKKKLDNYSLLEIDLETGRHHQIRAQLSFIGSPIKGDLKYGASRSNKDGSIHLHARTINFTHPVSKKTITIIAPIPNEVIWNACK
ncbi:RluA family pseudouridine synthase [Flavobacteriaceae bacterium]|jgi:23S rRNA pseudouridine1911/1915/1917 synthase|nr:RluA family pseudouridine synthase [Flavobacteriaceae bacterium]MDB2417777.1 RluA family pseudouridine synthase [Flavobacteriaceae bacterium]MDB2491148.1 RluA family pseudouridine synthase [Flavobacteriaceae bacterium]MDB2625409.1 RluA family pseudouridine synthase [Flavobacteriaceae bacterium]MDB2657751.1 RluA family pseudouridine synthase [Flavobacteriaceae bacterium]|tara:strand:+ start:17033 stop:17719 length:687 start_codon:yes stop_codon:yes gene_type:complete